MTSVRRSGIAPNVWREVVEEKVLVDGMWRDDVYQLESVLVKLSLDVLPHTHIDRIVPILHLVVLTIRFSIYCYLLCQKGHKKAQHTCYTAKQLQFCLKIC